MGGLAALRVLDRGALEGPKADRYVELAGHLSPRVRAAAVALLARHPELESPHAHLIRALTDDAPEPMSEAAGLLSQPRRWPWLLQGASIPALLETVPRALERVGVDGAPEVERRLLRVLLVLGAEGPEALVRERCASQWAATRAEADRFLVASGKAPCGAAAAEPGPAQPLVGQLRVEAESDVGPLGFDLWSADGGRAARALADAVAAGHWTQVRVERRGVHEAAVISAAAGPPVRLPAEESPLFAPLRGVGFAALDGEAESSRSLRVSLPGAGDDSLVLVGAADAGWDLLLDGDEVRGFRLLEKAAQGGPRP